MGAVPVRDLPGHGGLTVAPSPRRLLAETKFRSVRRLGKVVSSTGRRAGRRRPPPGRDGAFTVLTVSWNTLDYLRVLVTAVQRYSPPGTEIVVVDNASNDGTREYLDGAGVTAIKLPINLGHGPAMDLATSRVGTEYFVTLDVDAFPVRADWLDVLRGELERGSTVVGGHMHRGFAHPSMLAMRTTDFRARNHTFLRSGWRTSADFEHGTSWDVGELISMREGDRVKLIQPSEIRGPGPVGTVYGGIVYHNALSSHGKPENRVAARAAWLEAEARFLPADC
jgi:hypothetical protein